MPLAIRWRSVRTRLTLWNVAVLGLVLVGFAAALLLAVDAWLRHSVEQELVHRIAPVVGEWERGGPMRGPGGAGPPQFQPQPMGTPDGAHVPLVPLGVRLAAQTAEGQGLRPFPPARPLAPGPDLRQQDPFPQDRPVPDLQGDLRRPRLLNPEGGPLFPGPFDGPLDPAAMRVALEGRPVFTTVEREGEPVRVLSIPLRRPDGVQGVAQAAYPLAEQQRLYSGLVSVLCTLVPLALLIAGVGGAFLTGRALQPVRSVIQAASEIGAEDLSRRLPVDGDDEFAELSGTFNGMIARLEEAFHRLETAYEQQRRIAGDASHELRTPLTTLKANTSLALASPRAPSEYRAALQAADEAADTMTRIVQDLLLLARSDSGRLQLQARPVELEPVLRKAAASLPPGAGAPVSLELPPAGAKVLGDEHHLTRLFLNLLENAVRHTPTEGSVRVQAVTQEGCVLVRVEDTGEGIPPEDLPHVCERFYRVDAARAHEGYRAGSGTGLGLAICQSIIEAHGGSLSIESRVGQGTAVTVRLPQRDPYSSQ